MALYPSFCDEKFIQIRKKIPTFNRYNNTYPVSH